MNAQFLTPTTLVVYCGVRCPERKLQAIPVQVQVLQTHHHLFPPPPLLTYKPGPWAHRSEMSPSEGGDSMEGWIEAAGLLRPWLS